MERTRVSLFESMLHAQRASMSPNVISADDDGLLPATIVTGIWGWIRGIPTEELEATRAERARRDDARSSRHDDRISRLVRRASPNAPWPAERPRPQDGASR